MAAENNDIIISGSTLDDQVEEYKQKYEYFQPIFNTLIKLNNVPFFLLIPKTSHPYYQISDY